MDLNYGGNLFMYGKGKMISICVAMVGLFALGSQVFASQAIEAGGLTVANLPLEDVVEIDDQILLHAGQVDIPLPPLPSKPGKIIVLRFNAFSHHHRAGGFGWNLRVAINGNPLDKFVQGGDIRVVGRNPSWQLRSRDWQLFSDSMIRTMFAPDMDTAHTMIPDGQGAAFGLNISDAARGVDGNTLRLFNLRGDISTDPERDLIIRDIQIGWLDKSILPDTPHRIPQRTAIGESTTRDGLRLAQATGGGFAVKGGDVELKVETVLSMDRDAPSSLIAGDGNPEGAKVNVQREGSTGYRITAIWPDITLVRTLQLENGYLQWKEHWTNTSEKNIGVPFRHRVFLNEEPTARFYLGGNRYSNNLTGKPTNPTVFIESKKTPGHGAGITLESDWLRLLVRMRHAGGVGDIYSVDLALPPGGSIDFDLTVQLVEDDGGYWTFINDVRRRWGVNGGTAERPFFWNWAGKWDQIGDEWIPKEMTADVWKAAFGHLGPVSALLWVPRHPMLRLGPDAETITHGRYPKLPDTAPRTPGGTPDLDVEAFLSFEHREPYWKRVAEQVELVHQTLPNVELIIMNHSAMECVYAPMVKRWPYYKEVIQTASGEPYNSPTYDSRVFADYSGTDIDWVSKGWKVIYFVPRPNSVYLDAILSSMRRVLDECHADGIYNDEFSWAWHRRDYSRYDYSQWDGYSADLDDQGNVVALKTDNGYVTRSAQARTLELIRKRGKFFLGNGAPVLRSVNELRSLCYNEGGQGVGEWAAIHLGTVPMILGNFDTRGNSQQSAFNEVKQVLEAGCIYSPHACNLVLDGPDNFVCKQYPVTIQEIGSGVIKAEERLITTHSGEFNWPGHGATVVLYVYNQEGDLMDRENLPTVETDPMGLLMITVPPEGMVIAEIKE